MNWYKILLASNKEHLMTNSRELEQFLNRNGFYPNRSTGHVQWCHREMPSECVHIQHQKSKGYKREIVYKIIGEVKNILNEVEKREKRLKEERKEMELEKKQKWVDTPWYQEQLKYRELELV
jgi:predicted RNA binding protein YcfA (HicA-like mRNA interferase family)